MERGPGESRTAGGGAGREEGAPGTSGSRLREAVAAATDRVQEIVDAAERVAHDVRREAEAEAERYLAERRREADRLAAGQRELLEQVATTLRERLASLEAQGAALVAEVERALERLGAGDAAPSEGRPPASPLSPVPEPRGSQPVAEVAPPAGEPASTAGVRDPGAGELRERALIRATQMAVSGSGREEIESALRTELGVAEPAPIVDEILGR